MSIYIYEDDGWRNLLPLTYLHPVFDLSCGMWTPRQRAERIYGEVIPISRFHKDKKEKGLYINGRAILHTKISLKGKNKVLKSKDEIVAYISENGKIPEDAKEEVVDADVLKYPWDIIKFNKKTIKADFESGRFTGRGNIPVCGGSEMCFVDDSARLHKGVYLNTENGPIFIDKNAVVYPSTSIYGPSYIGKDAIIDNAIIREGSYVGRGCKIGGEIEESIFSSFSNKHHTGFVGHSYLGEWVNLGALTTTSDLKNNYSNVKVTTPQGEIDTGLLKLGSIIGDHTKTGIGTLLTTGCIIGIFCNIYGGGMFDKYLKSFSWGTKEELTVYKIDKAIETAKKVMARRGVIPTEQYINRIREIFYNNVKFPITNSQ